MIWDLGETNDRSADDASPELAAALHLLHLLLTEYPGLLDYDQSQCRLRLGPELGP